MLRLVEHDYLLRDEVPHKTDGYVYSLSERGTAELIGLGEYCTGPTYRPRDGQLPRAIYHAIELNEIHLALKRSQQLVRWMAESEIHSRNELAGDRYGKDYDAVVTVRNEIGEPTFALEYERSPKARKEYLEYCGRYRSRNEQWIGFFISSRTMISYLFWSAVSLT